LELKQELDVKEIVCVGSCRILEPLRSVGLNLNQKSIYGYTHNTKEHIQLIKTVGIMPSWESYVYNMVGRKKDLFLKPLLISDDRIFVVEICSIRVLEYDGVFLQLNRFYEFCNQFADNKKKPISFQDQDSIRSWLSNIKSLPFNYKKIKFYEQNQQEIIDDVNELISILGSNVIFVSHFNVDNFGGSIPQRKIIIEALKYLEFQTGINFYDPTSDVLAKGFKSSCIDAGHYQDYFINVIGNSIKNKIIGLCT
jgi:hypothetical protein